MIRKTYSTGINCVNPETYFERFWAHCWYNIAGFDSTGNIDVLIKAVGNELAKEDITIIHYYNINKVDIIFPTTESYTWFKLKWL